VPHCPLSNRKAESLNRTLIEKARCMMIAANIPQYLWTAAVETANYLRNRSPSSILLNKTPYENYPKVLPNLSHLRMFGCEAYLLDLNNSASKFEERAMKNCTMIGYGKSESIIGYLIKPIRKYLHQEMLNLMKIQ
jgi:hypothetical protein